MNTKLDFLLADDLQVTSLLLLLSFKFKRTLTGCELDDSHKTHNTEQCEDCCHLVPQKGVSIFCKNPKIKKRKLKKVNRIGLLSLVTTSNVNLTTIIFHVFGKMFEWLVDNIN